MYKKIVITDFDVIKSHLSNLPVLQSEIEKYKLNIKHELDKWVNSFIASVNKENPVIDMEEIRGNFFPIIKSDIFLSHSHANESEILKLAVVLENMGIKVFVDSVYWGYAGDLKDKLDDEFAKNSNSNSYNHSICTHNSQNIFLTLASCLTTMIDESELFMFCQTSESLPINNLSNKATYSPWIMLELDAVDKMQTKESRYGGSTIAMDGLSIEESKALLPPKFVHSVELKNLLMLQGYDFINLLNTECKSKEKWFQKLYRYIGH